MPYPLMPPGLLGIPAVGTTPATLDESTMPPPNPMSSMANMLAGAVQGADPGMLSRMVNKLTPAAPGQGSQFGTMSAPGLPGAGGLDKSGQMPQPPAPGPIPRSTGAPPLAALQQLMQLQRR